MHKDLDNVTNAAEETETLNYKIFDADPNESGGYDWGSRSGPDAEDYEDAGELAADALDWAVSEAGDLSDYSVGDTLYVTVYLPDGTSRTSSRTIEATDWELDARDVSRWESVATYVQCCYGTDGDQPGECTTRIGSVRGVWFADAGDDNERETIGQYDSREDAESAAEEYATENDEEP